CSEQRFDEIARSARATGIEWFEHRSLIHVCALRQFELYRTDTFRRLPIVQRDVTAGESAVQDGGISAVVFHCTQQGSADLSMARRIAAGPEIQVEAHTREQSRNLAGNGMRIPQRSETMLRADAQKLFAQPIVIRPPVLLYASDGFSRGRCLARQVDLFATES